MAQKPSIFINPKFKNILINPNFVQQNNKVVHVNPKFFAGINLVAFQPPPPSEPLVKPPLPPAPVVSSNAIIRNTRRTLIRAPGVDMSRSNVPVVSSQQQAKLPAQTQLIKISKNKLVTAAHLMKCQQKENEIIKNATESIIKTKKLRRREVEKPESIYKFDRTALKKKKIVSTYSIRRESPKKPIKS